MTVFLVSLMGVPPLLGFYAKYYVILAAIDADLLWLAIAVVLLSAVSAFFYLRVVAVMYFSEPERIAARRPRPRCSTSASPAWSSPSCPRPLLRPDHRPGRRVVRRADGRRQHGAVAESLGVQKLPLKFRITRSHTQFSCSTLISIQESRRERVSYIVLFSLHYQRASTELSVRDRYRFKVIRIMSHGGGPGVFHYLQDIYLGTNKFAFRTLSRLHEIVHRESIINYFEEESQDLDKVLNIFIRVNSCVTTLSYSHLLPASPPRSLKTSRRWRSFIVWSMS